MMSGRASEFVGDIPSIYDQGLGPVFFADFADDIARRAASARPTRVLEIAAGTGIVTRRLRDQLPAQTRLTATDLNSPMLEVARAKFGPDDQIAFQPADGAALPFPDEGFDAVVCQFGLMFFPDKAKGLREAHRMLTPGGQYLFSVWDSHAHNPIGRLITDVLTGFFPADPPQFYQVPFSCHRIDPIRDGLVAAGFTGLRISILSIEKTISDVPLYARALVYGNPLIDQIRARGGVDPEKVVDALTTAIPHEFGTAPAQMPLQAIVFEARR